MSNLTDKDIEVLGNNGHFIKFLLEIRQRREVAIKELSNADKDGVMKIAGRIEELDRLMDLAKYDQLVERYERMAG